MTIEEKAKAYDEALEKVRPLYEQAIKDGNPIGSTYEYLIPQLTESEDEKIMDTIIEHFKGFSPIKVFGDFDFTSKQILAYLEKMKENPKSADSISPDCMSDANFEDRWHKVTDSLPDNGREVLAKDKFGNTLLARYDGEGWDVSVYDDEDYRCHNGISKWREIPSEKQKEQKHPNGCFTCDEYKKGYEAGRLNGFTAGYNKAMKEQKPAEWSEEDMDMLNSCISSIEEAKENRYAYKETDGDTSYDHEIDWLKSLRPSWKPSEEQMKALESAGLLYAHGLERRDRAFALASLYEQLKELM